ncbi:sulfotransferase family protein [Enemella sp. A6]|uniref:sulfotransferase family protein n=1 Tax=Enemella sp. A6 TaxID=3440152 RepID=UPI003EC02896
MSNRIRIDDLRDPVLTEEQKAMEAHLQQKPVELSVDAVLAAAREQTGLDDFGPMDFTERLAVILAGVDGDPNRTAVSRASLFGNCVNYAANRLKVMDLLKRHPEIHDVQITAPVIVVGLPRSGTTHLVNLLAADSRFRSLQLWESQEPVPVPGEEPVDGVDPRYLRSAKRWEHLQARSPLVAAMHPMNPDHIHEELELTSIDFASYNFEWLTSLHPTWRDYQLSHDQRPHYEFTKLMLKVLQWQRGPERWVLKCPQHLELLGPLMDTYPDATVVMTHRDPVSVVQSAVTMNGYGARMQFKKVDIDALFEYWADRVDRLLTAGTRDLTTIPPEKRIDVHFGALMDDDWGTVEEIYRRIGLEFTEQAQAEIRHYLDTHPRGKHGQVVYDLRGDFHVEPADLRARYRHYLEAFDVQEEVT